MSMRKSITDLRNRYKGETVYIVGSGPSVKEVDFRLIEDKVTVFVNGAIKLLENRSFERPVFVTTDARYLLSLKQESYKEIFSHRPMLRLLRADLKPLDDDCYKKNTHYIKPLGRDGFSHDLDIGFYYGCTSVMLAIQAAWYFGAQKCVLIGVDLTQILGASRFYIEENPQPADSFYGVQVWNITNARREFVKANKSLVITGKESLLRPYIPFEIFEKTLLA